MSRSNWKSVLPLGLLLLAACTPPPTAIPASSSTPTAAPPTRTLAPTRRPTPTATLTTVPPTRTLPPTHWPTPTTISPTVSLDEGWQAYILAGQEFLVVLDETHHAFDDSTFTGQWETDPLGTLKGGETYTVKFICLEGWETTGYNQGQADSLTRIYPATNAPPTENKISLWGAVFSFNIYGEVFHTKYGLVGHLRQPAQPNPAAAGIPGASATPVPACPGAPPITLRAGSTAMVSLEPAVPSRLRAQPGLTATFVGQVQPGQYVKVVAGPQCADGYAWWKVSSTTGLEGWTVEGDSSGYWLVPPADSGLPEADTSPNAPPDNTPAAPSVTRAAGKYGLTWGKSTYNSELGILRVSCLGQPPVEGSQRDCNPYTGDTPCSTARPILCLKPENLPRPNYAVTGSGYTMPVEFYFGWAGGHIGLTQPIVGTKLTSIAAADAFCAAALGPGYRMAEHHDGYYVVGMDTDSYYGDTWPAAEELSTGGWHWYAYGNLPDDTRFWVHINDRPGNCWNADAMP